MSSSGVPVVGTGDTKSDKSPESKAKREAATADALAKAKAMVEAEQKKSAKSETKATTDETVNPDHITTDQEANGKSEEVGVPGSNKRLREEDEEGRPEAKKVDRK